jgi:hypothetical protein
MPRWLRNLERFFPLKSQFVLSGNVRDLQAVQMAITQLARSENVLARDMGEAVRRHKVGVTEDPVQKRRKWLMYSRKRGWCRRQDLNLHTPEGARP